MTRIALAVVVLSLGVSGVLARQQKPTFEIASVKRQTDSIPFADAMAFAQRGRSDRVFTAGNVTVESLIAQAYDLKPFQVAGGPAWIRRDRFQIEARAADDVSPDQKRLMVQSLLEDRFKLVAHMEQREMRMAALVPARSDGQLGPYLRRVEDDCNREKIDEVRKSFPPRATTASGGMMTGRCTEAASIANLLSLSMGMVVKDETGLRGRFTYEVRYASGPSPSGASTTAADPGLPPVAAALEEQLGLKLREQVGPVDVLVVESVQPPTEN